MSFSKSKSSNTTQQTTYNTSENLNIQDSDGATVAKAGGDVTIINSDHNAIGNATELATRSVDVAGAIAADAQSLSLKTSLVVSDLASGALIEQTNLAGKAFAFGDAAFGTVEKALGEVSGAYQDSAAYQSKALTTVADVTLQTNEGLAGALGSAFDRVLGFVQTLQTGAQKQLGDTVTTLNAIARESSKSTDERVAEVSAGAQKTVLYIVGFIAGAAVLYSIFKR